MDGILPVWKPANITSYDVIREFKRSVHPQYKVGHGGTLDPFAEGVLLLLLGKATKKMNELMNLRKTYRATAVLGAKSDTLDKTGSLTRQHVFTIPRIELIEEVAKQFVGVIEQEIPDYSAAKVNGVPRYKLARKGDTLTKKSKTVTIYELNIVSLNADVAVFEATVSSGTYIRQLSYDLFKSVGVESYLCELIRTQIGEYGRERCVEISSLATEGWRDKVVQL